MNGNSWKEKTKSVKAIRQILSNWYDRNKVHVGKEKSYIHIVVGNKLKTFGNISVCSQIGT